MSKVEDFITPELERSIEFIFQDTKAPAVITKDKFDKHILPFLLHRAAGKEGFDITIINDYVGPYKELSVTDEAGVELFRLPPLYSSLPIRKIEINGQRVSLDLIINEYLARKQAGEGAAADDWFVTIAGIDAVAMDKESLAEQLRFLSMWVNFYNIYNIDISDKLPSLKGLEKQGSISSSSPENRNYEYEDM